MKRLRHPNIVLLMGAVIQPPKLSIVTEYLSRYYNFLKRWKLCSSLMCLIGIDLPECDILMQIVSLNCRGSLYELLHMPNVGSSLSERRRLSMAYDVVYVRWLKLPVFLFLCLFCHQVDNNTFNKTEMFICLSRQVEWIIFIKWDLQLFIEIWSLQIFWLMIHSLLR